VVAGSTVTCPHCGGAGIVRSVESTALRVLRALEEEGEKNRASAVTVKVAGDVAIYALNQKRRELARIEAEYGMEVSFEPKDGLLAGTFEIERTRSRDPGERPRSSAVSIEAGFVPSDEPEEDLPPEEEEEDLEEAEETGEAESLEMPAEPRADQPRGDDERGRGRRRRRRGGRGRNRHRDDNRGEGAPSLPVEAANGEAPAPAGEDENTPQAASPTTGPLPGQPGDGEGRRRRRRRRGRRGGRDRDRDFNGQPEQPGFASEADRFGAAPDEIDTTPRDDLPAHAPGTPSAPVWSLKDDIPDTTPIEEPVSAESKPKKKGWWQRTFSGE
jgi:ribonuclease E